METGRKQSFAERLRMAAEKYLREAAEEEMIKRYGDACTRPFRSNGVVSVIIRRLAVPLFLRIPWSLRRQMILRASYPSGRRPDWSSWQKGLSLKASDQSESGQNSGAQA